MAERCALLPFFAIPEPLPFATLLFCCLFDRLIRPVPALWLVLERRF